MKWKQREIVLALLIKDCQNTLFLELRSTYISIVLRFLHKLNGKKFKALRSRIAHYSIHKFSLICEVKRY